MRALLAPVWPWLAAVGAVLAAAFGIHRAGRSSGISDTTQKQKEEDHARARKIQDAADQARADALGRDAVSVLHDAGRLRD